MSKITFPATVSKVSTMADGSIRLSLDTQEITDPEKAAGLFMLWGKYGQCLFSLEDITEDTASSLPKAPEKPGKQKSQSQRLRAVLYRLWEAKGKPGESEQFYTRMMEQIIGHYKNQIEE